jgi:hypothetical protein
MENTISIKLGKKVVTFNIERTICGICLTNPENSGIMMELDQRQGKGNYHIISSRRELEFFEEELADVARKFIKKNKI